ncbi:hypothetical protein C8R44DRAFT_815663, partial [Mycena epipterygia]
PARSSRKKAPLADVSRGRRTGRARCRRRCPKYVESTGQDRLDKEREVWDAFKDEHIEVFDLSSSLWRCFDLVRELDQQDAKTTTALLNAFMKYVHLRRDTATSPQSEPENLGSSVQNLPPVPTEGSSTATSDQPMPATNGASSSSPFKHVPVAPAPSDQLSTRELLATIAKFSEASIRDREEKVNLTRAL